MQVQLGALASESSSYNPVKSTSATHNEIPTIVENLNGLLGLTVKAKAHQKSLQDEEDINNAKFVAHNDITNIETARTTGNSPDQELNSVYQKGKEANLTETEINNNMYDVIIGRRAGEIQGEAGKGDNKYFESMVTAKNTMWSKLAVEDKAKIVNEQLNKAYAIAGTDANLQGEFTNSAIVAKKYGQTEDSVGNLYIYRAIDRAKAGDDRLLNELKNIKNSSGVSIVDTVAGAEAYSKKVNELATWRDQESQRVERKHKLDQQANADALYVKFVNTTDMSSVLSELQLSVKQDKIDFQTASTLTSVIKHLADSRQFASSSNVDYYYESYSKAISGELDVKNIDKNKLSHNDALALTKIQADNGSVEGKAKEEIRSVETNMILGAKSIVGLGLQDTVISAIYAPELQARLGSYSVGYTKKALSEFRVRTGRQPSFEEQQVILEDTKKAVDAQSKIWATEAKQSKANQPSSPANQVISATQAVQYSNMLDTYTSMYTSSPYQAQEYLSRLDSKTKAEILKLYQSRNTTKGGTNGD